MCVCVAVRRRCLGRWHPKPRRSSLHARASPKPKAAGWTTSRFGKTPMLEAEHRHRSPWQKGRRAKSARRPSRFKISEDRCSEASPKQMCHKNQNPQNGQLMARFDWGSGAICFGASPVAAVFGSAPGSATPPEHRIHFKPSSQAALLKQDISTLLGIGHFYFALTRLPRSGQRTQYSPILHRRRRAHSHP